MQACVIIPVWNGVASIGDCLQTLLDTADAQLDTVVCVDNASTDGSADLIAADFPQVRLVPQPVNLGFAGGVNAGVAATQANLIVLLNQDCIVQPGWLDGFAAVMEEHADCGAVGCMIYAADRAINHAGATITRPLAYGQHLTVPLGAAPYPVEYATGAFLACRRDAWEQVGGMDEDFYPAYYEESDFCLRLQRHGWRVLVTPAVQATHLFTSREWQRDPVLHNAQQHRSRYRFVCKQFDDAELLAFFAAELAACAAEPYFHQAIGRALASRYLLRHLPELAAARAARFDVAQSRLFQRVAAVKFGQIYRDARQRAYCLAAPDGVDATQAFEPWQQSLAAVRADLAQSTAQAGDPAPRSQQLEALHEARRLYEEITTLTDGTAPWLLRASQALYHLQERQALLLSLQTRLIAAHDATVARLDLLETAVNQRLALLEHQLDLTETQLTRLEFQRRVDALLVEYEQF